ncbi:MULTISPECIES: glycoside hydrolase family 2 protein [unclassified Streptomyces]|uniref:glycoside hydrolase family 2 protein n=1 Tax=unclassified Streptomyces TaxID=2593676 RepID=UPI0006ADE4CE|nr:MULTISPECIES: exo-beta-D-glucosaminidase [unclassified Streptomyces]KOU85128.1 exo-beta-D-glucosaminidase [Streptomyces sp. XY58]KOV03299.1 exo-beta-D-glucosaminidase [Streptomyces sp. XY37]KOV47764.1 exo-beta-D-glucosaminidase [Streptomyces sp. MMG1064]
MVLLLTAGTTGAAPAAQGAAAPPSRSVTTVVPAAPGSATRLSGYAVQSTAKVADTAETVSSPGYPATGWYPAGPRSTVLAALLAAGVHPDPFHSTQQELIPAADFSVPWWYRSDFTVADTTARTHLDFSGVISAADVFVNGHRIATTSSVAGAYTRHEFDVTALIRPGTNTVAFRIQPNNPRKHLTMGWLDWLQPPPDENMGIVRDVTVRRAGPIALRDAHVVSALAMPSMATADLTVKARLRNDSDATVTTTLSGTVGQGQGQEADAAFARSVTLAPHETTTVAFSPAEHPALRLKSPRVWWPAHMGAQPMYELHLTATVPGTVASTGTRTRTPSDTARQTFGIRDVRAPLNADGARQYEINGRPLLVKGAGWSPDEFLRWDPTYTEDRLKYALDLGLNTLRLEGHIEPDEFFDLADRYGILTLPGWECCTKWEGEFNRDGAGERWSAADHATARASMAAEAARLRNHPGVISFLIGSDAAPTEEIERGYLDALEAADWNAPVIPAAADTASPITGRSGMKMTGPYDWVPPGYWYDKREGGASGFNSETSAGPDIPTLDTLRRMMTPAELETLWKDPGAVQYHRSPSATFDTLELYDAALTARYGAPASLQDYVRKAQLAQYENVRAQFEAYARNAKDPSDPSTGVIYWMFNSGWTSLHWQLVDRFLDQGGAYFGAKKANEPLHVQYGYDDHSVTVVNNRPAPASGLTARVTLFAPDGTQKYDRTVTGLSVAGGGASSTALTLPASVPGLPTTYLARLLLTDAAGREASRNVYWLSTEADVLDHERGDWFHTPTTSYADLRGLDSMARTAVTATASTTEDAASGTSTTTVTLRRAGTGGTPALLTDVHVVRALGEPVLPVRWNDNQVSLWPGESATLTATYRTADLRGSAPRLRVSGWNTPTVTVPAA